MYLKVHLEIKIMNNRRLNSIKLDDFRNILVNCEYYQFYIQNYPLQTKIENLLLTALLFSALVIT